MRKITIEDTKVLEILSKKNALTVENQNTLKEMGELEKKFNTCLTKSKMIDEKSRPMVKKLLEKMNLGEYEEVSAVRQDKNGGWYIEIADRMEEFKAQFAKLKETDIKTCS